VIGSRDRDASRARRALRPFPVRGGEHLPPGFGITRVGHEGFGPWDTRWSRAGALTCELCDSIIDHGIQVGEPGEEGARTTYSRMLLAERATWWNSAAGQSGAANGFDADSID